MSDPAETAPATPARRRRGYFLPGAIALVALLVIGAAVGAGDLVHPTPHALNGSDVSSEIALGIQVQRNTRTPPKVSCPAREAVEKGLQFHCTLSTGPGAAPTVVTVTEVDGRGHLRWALPPGPAASARK